MGNQSNTGDHQPVSIKTTMLRAVTLAALWWLITEGEASSWLIGVPVIVGIVAWQQRQPTAVIGRVRLLGLLGFIPFFLWRSFLGGCDVAWRTLKPGLPIHPALRRYPLRLPSEGPSRVLLANTINLLPGTATAELEVDALNIHFLTDTPVAWQGVVQLERRIARVFGLTLAESGGPPEVEHDT